MMYFTFINDMRERVILNPYPDSKGKTQVPSFIVGVSRVENSGWYE